jgi:hypothetical protein
MLWACDFSIIGLFSSGSVSRTSWRDIQFLAIGFFSDEKEPFSSSKFAKQWSFLLIANVQVNKSFHTVNELTFCAQRRHGPAPNSRIFPRPHNSHHQNHNMNRLSADVSSFSAAKKIRQYEMAPIVYVAVT